MRSRLRDLVLDKERREGRRIQQREIAEQTGLTEATVSKWMDPFRSFTQLRSDAVISLCRWVPCTYNDLLTMEREPVAGS